MKCNNCGAQFNSTDGVCHYCGSIYEHEVSNRQPNNDHYYSKDILNKYFTKLFNDKSIKSSNIYILSNIPEKKRNNAFKSYGANDQNTENVYLLFDSSPFGSGKTGFFITENFVYCNMNGESQSKIKNADIEIVTIKSSTLKGELYINNHYLGFFPSIGTTLKNDFHIIFEGIFKCSII
ncbi:MAG TPA: hypothetical protein P5295_14595 [Spirochaetota bacterium]|nr:hypothetical protein [Spirochaetota bacterium]